MGRFDRSDQRRFRARDAVLVVLLAAVLLILFEGASIRKAGEEMNSGVGREGALAVGPPPGWPPAPLPLASVSHSATAWLSPEPNLGGPGGFQEGAAGLAGRIPPVTPDAFDPSTIGAPAPPRRALHTLLVTGDSMSQPLDSDLAQLLAPAGVRVIREPHLGTGFSPSCIVISAQLAAMQVKQDPPDAVVVLIGANEGFPMTGSSGH